MMRAISLTKPSVLRVAPKMRPCAMSLREILAVRDQITADLAKGDAAVVSEMQPLLLKVEQGTKR